MPTITVTLTKQQLKNNFDDEVKAIPRLGILDSLSEAVHSKLNKSFPRNHISQVKAEELGDDIKFEIKIDHDRDPPKTSQDVKEALI
jgi:hypothetical protein